MTLLHKFNHITIQLNYIHKFLYHGTISVNEVIHCTTFCQKKILLWKIQEVLAMKVTLIIDKVTRNRTGLQRKLTVQNQCDFSQKNKL